MPETRSYQEGERMWKDEFSPDGIRWEHMPESVGVWSNELALRGGNVRYVDAAIDESQYVVGFGANLGQRLDPYGLWRTGKVLANHEPAVGREPKLLTVRILADILPPYAGKVRVSGLSNG